MKRILTASCLLLVLLFLLPILLLPTETDAAATATPSAVTATLPPDPTASAPAPTPVPTAVSAGADAARSVRLQTVSGIQTLSLDHYLFCVVAAEMPASFEPEALKAQAIAARTYALRKLSTATPNHPDADLCTDSSCCCAYLTQADLSARWGDKAAAYTSKLRAAVLETDGQVILYDGKPINALFHAASSGRTESSALVWGASVPYLTGVSSPEDSASVPQYQSTVIVSASQFRAAFLAAYPAARLSGAPSSWFGAPVYSDAGKVLSLAVGGVTVTGRALRTLFQLRSAAFSLAVAGEQITFSVKGYGHGVGMSQYGANVYAKQGWDCVKILAWYYQGTTIGPYPTA